MSEVRELECDLLSPGDFRNSTAGSWVTDRASRLYLGPPPPRHGGHDEYQSVATDRAGITVFREMTFLAAGPASERNR